MVRSLVDGRLHIGRKETWETKLLCRLRADGLRIYQSLYLSCSRLFAFHQDHMTCLASLSGVLVYSLLADC